jgi:hypothetical protein
VYNLNIYSKKGGIFEKFFDDRSSLIVQFKTGKITKKQFLEDNYQLVQKMNLRPFLRIDNYEMGMYNYQYYNVLAKYFTSMAKEIQNTKKHQRYYNYYLNKGNNYYHEKDKAALNLLEFLEFKGIEAYYIKVASRSLNNKLYEIVLLNYKEAIFHSKSITMLKVLKEKGVFQDGQKVSVIDEYINETY